MYTYIWMCTTSMPFSLCSISVCVYMCMRVCACMHVCVCACVDVYVRASICLTSVCAQYLWVMAHIWTSHGSHINGTRYTYKWDLWTMTHPEKWDTLHMIHDSLIFHSRVSHDSIVNHHSSICHKWDALHIWVSHGSHVHGRWHVRHGTRIHDSCHTYEWFMAHVWMGHIKRMHTSCHRCKWVMSHI